jgi:hypothetical protein
MVILSDSYSDSQSERFKDAQGNKFVGQPLPVANLQDGRQRARYAIAQGQDARRPHSQDGCATQSGG